jgi:hypothetical protein
MPSGAAGAALPAGGDGGGAALVERTVLPLHAIAARAGVYRDIVTKLRRRHGWSRPRAPRMALNGERGGGHPIVPEVAERAAALVEGAALSHAASPRPHYRSPAPIS